MNAGAPFTAADWIPEHQIDSALGLGHVNALFERTLDLHFQYINGDEPITPKSVISRFEERLLVERVRPLPRGLARSAADLLNAMRQVLEHAIFAEVELLLGRELDSKARKAVELPHRESRESLEQWANDKRRRTLTPLHVGQELWNRIESLQPYHRVSDPAVHPLRVLAEYSNYTKHQRPLGLAVCVGALFAENGDSRLVVSDLGEEGVQPGDLLASCPRGAKIPIAMFPTIRVRQVHTGRWVPFVDELKQMETWVRTIAYPMLVAGRTDLPAVDPAIDIARGYTDLRDAIASAAPLSAAELSDRRLSSAVARVSLPGMLAVTPRKFSLQVAQEFVANMSDDEVLSMTLRFQEVRSDLPALLALIESIEGDLENFAAMS